MASIEAALDASNAVNNDKPDNSTEEALLASTAISSYCVCIFTEAALETSICKSSPAKSPFEVTPAALEALTLFKCGIFIFTKASTFLKELNFLLKNIFSSPLETSVFK